MDSFPEYVKCLAEDQKVSMALIQEHMGWSFAQARSVKTGTLKAQQISFKDAVDLADLLNVSVDDLAQAAELK